MCDGVYWCVPSCLSLCFAIVPVCVCVCVCVCVWTCLSFAILLVSLLVSQGCLIASATCYFPLHISLFPSHRPSTILALLGALQRGEIQCRWEVYCGKNKGDFDFAVHVENMICCVASVCLSWFVPPLVCVYSFRWALIGSLGVSWCLGAWP